MKAVAPAKVILSGEHAVVYGAPALATAVRHYACAEVTSTASAGQVALALPDLGLGRILSVDAITPLYHCCRDRHQAYLQGRLPIAAVADAIELACCALGWLLDQRLVVLPQAGLRIELQSRIPIGAGMGSSAAIGAALLAAMAAYGGASLPPELLRQGVQQIEQFQHGRSSGLDPAVCVQGGLLRYEGGGLVPLHARVGGHWWLVHSGQPLSSTGECVEQVRRGFADSRIWGEFGCLTDALATALARGDRVAVTERLRHNHRLLCQIGVVPASVRRFIADIEVNGGAAKISGAGSVRGEAGGLILVYHPESEQPPVLPSGYRLLDMELDHHGTRIRD